jgi:hypothetical protein
MSEQGREYAAFISAQLAAEDARRTSVNSRAGAALTGASGLVTLVLAVFAVVIPNQHIVLSGWAKGLLAAALFALLACAFCAVMAGLPWRFNVTALPTLHRMVEGQWTDNEVDARNVTAHLNTLVLGSLRSGTEIKVRFLMAAGIGQLVAVAALALCTLAVLDLWPGQDDLDFWTCWMSRFFDGFPLP